MTLIVVDRFSITADNYSRTQDGVVAEDVVKIQTFPFRKDFKHPEVYDTVGMTGNYELFTEFRKDEVLSNDDNLRYITVDLIPALWEAWLTKPSNPWRALKESFTLVIVSESDVTTMTFFTKLAKPVSLKYPWRDYITTMAFGDAVTGLPLSEDPWYRRYQDAYKAGNLPGLNVHRRFFNEGACGETEWTSVSDPDNTTRTRRKGRLNRLLNRK